MNDKLFRPHGLFCLIMTYKPEQKASHEQVDISKTIAKSITPSDSKVREQLKGLKLSSAKTYGELGNARIRTTNLPSAGCSSGLCESRREEAVPVQKQLQICSELP